jgi:hypothetical protein
MDIAIVTGANTRIGLAISRKLIDVGCRVYGLAGSFRDCAFEHSDFIPVTCDLTNTEHLCKVVQEIIDREENIYILVNLAKHLNLGPHEQLELNDLESLVHTNLLAPLVLTRLALPSLIRLQGYVLNIGFSDLPGNQRLGSAFLSTEVALKQFSDRLYEEVRQDKVKVCCLSLDAGIAEFLFNERLNRGDNHDLIVCSEAIAQAVEFVISQKRESVVSSMVVRPQQSEPYIQGHKETRKLALPNPYKTGQTTKNVVIHRLKKKAVPESDEKVPTTYMNMAREVAEEEARGPDRLVNETDSQPKRRPRRRRSRRKDPQGPQQGGVEDSDKSSSESSVKGTNKSPPKKRQSKKEKGLPRSESNRGQRDTERKRVSKKATMAPALLNKGKAQKVTTQKKLSRNDRSENSLTKKGVAKKISSKKRRPIEPFKKTVKKRSSSKTYDS